MPALLCMCVSCFYNFNLLLELEKLLLVVLQPKTVNQHMFCFQGDTVILAKAQSNPRQLKVILKELKPQHKIASTNKCFTSKGNTVILEKHTVILHTLKLPAHSNLGAEDTAENSKHN